MKNVLLKNNLMFKKKTSEILVNIPNRGNLEYDYEYTKTLSEDRENYNEIYFNKSMPTDSTVLNYKGVRFNMITCPAGGKVNINNWGEQEIKKPFMLSETEVTQELFLAVMGFNYSNFKESNKNPVERVRWHDCLEFCNILSDYFGLDHCYTLSVTYYSESKRFSLLSIETANGFRLPKEWEWQIAAMAGTNNQYAGANDIGSLKRVAWFNANSGNKTHPVAQKIPNEWGFYDMTGNVMEWVENSETPDQNNDSSAARTVCGGAFDSSGSSLKSVYHADFYSDRPLNNIGFRVARSI